MRQTVGSMEFFRSIICRGQTDRNRMVVALRTLLRRQKWGSLPWVSEGSIGILSMRQQSLISQQASGKEDEEQDLQACIAF